MNASLSEVIDNDKSKNITVSEFIKALQEWEEITEKEAIEQFRYFIEKGLRIYSEDNLETFKKIKKGRYASEYWVVRTCGDIDIHAPKDNVIRALDIALEKEDLHCCEAIVHAPKLEDFLNPSSAPLSKREENIRKALEYVPLKDLFVLRDETFQLFKDELDLSEPFPWAYPDIEFKDKKTLEKKEGRKLTKREYLEIRSDKATSNETDHQEKQSITSETSQKSNQDKLPEEKPLSSVERETLLRMIKALFIMHVKKVKGGRYGTDKEANKATIRKDMDQALYNLDMKTKGLSKRTVTNKFNEIEGKFDIDDDEVQNIIGILEDAFKVDQN